MTGRGQRLLPSYRPPAAAELRAQVRDISAGGMGIVCFRLEQDPPRISMGERLRILISLRDQQVLIEGRAKFLQVLPSGDVRVGIEFCKLEDDFDGRLTLSKLSAIVAELEREEVRRIRLGMAG